MEGQAWLQFLDVGLPQPVFISNQRASDLGTLLLEGAFRPHSEDVYKRQLYANALTTYLNADATHRATDAAAPQLPGSGKWSTNTPGYGTNTITRGLMSNFPAVLTGQNPGSLALSILNAGYLLDVELSAIQTQGRGEVISNPRIVTSNQKEAVIRQGKEIGYLTVTGTGGQLTPTVAFKEALLELKVTPTITNDGRVFLNLGVKKDELDGWVNMGTFGQVPQIAKREVNTAVLVEDGQTVVIGGVYEFSCLLYTSRCV